MTPEEIKPGHTYECIGNPDCLVLAVGDDSVTYRDCYGVAESGIADFASACVRDITPAPESDQGEKVAQAQSQGASCGCGGRTPLTDLSTIAANLITCQGLPDPDEPYRPLGKRWMREHRQRSVRMGNAIAAAVAQLRKAQNAATPPAADAVKDDLLAVVRQFVIEWDATWVDPDDINHDWAELYSQARAAIARAEANQ